MEDKSKDYINHLHIRVLAYTCMIYFAVMLFFNFLRFWGYGFSTQDFGTFYQLIWNTAHGNYFQSSTKFPYGATDSRLGFHFSVLVTLVGTFVYKILPLPEALLGLHVFSVTLAVVPLFYAVKKITGRSGTALFWGLVYLLNPLTLYHAMFSLEDVSLAVFFMTLSLYAIVEKRAVVFIFSVICLVLAKEQYGLTVAGLGVVWGLWNKSWKLPLAVISAGLTAFYIVLFQIIPYFSPYHEHFLLSNQINKAGYYRYQWIYKPFGEAVSYLINLVFSKNNLLVVAYQFLPLLFLPLYGWIFLLPALPDFAVNLLSSTEIQKKIYLYYWAGTVPFLIMAAAHGADKIKFGRRYLYWAISLLVFIPGALVTMIPARNVGLLLDKRMDWSFGEGFAEMKKHIPPDGLIIVDGGAGPHFANRRQIAPTDKPAYEKADMIVFRVNPYEFSPLVIEGTYIYAYNNISEVMKSEDFGVVYWQYPWIIFKRGAKNDYDKDQIKREIAAALKLFQEDAIRVYIDRL